MCQYKVLFIHVYTFLGLTSVYIKIVATVATSELRFLFFSQIVYRSVRENKTFYIQSNHVVRIVMSNIESKMGMDLNYIYFFIVLLMLLKMNSK